MIDDAYLIADCWKVNKRCKKTVSVGELIKQISCVKNHDNHIAKSENEDE
jgi:hypothetical protein